MELYEIFQYTKIVITDYYFSFARQNVRLGQRWASLVRTVNFYPEYFDITIRNEAQFLQHYLQTELINRMKWTAVSLRVFCDSYFTHDLPFLLGSPISLYYIKLRPNMMFRYKKNTTRKDGTPEQTPARRNAL